ncbi:MAG TPA: multicopper oxidase domain-containing protein [Gemmatimonadaceae bacterium]|nr:multicopper oxidase domain-containing protein [Gemmatimonadaceae bacterium]
MPGFPPPSDPPLLSDLLTELGTSPSSRRAFLGRGALGLVVGGAALAGCRPEQGGTTDSARTGGGAAAGTGAQPPRARNADSKLDTALHHPPTHGSSAVPGATTGAAAATFRRYDPALPPLASERTLRLHWRAQEVPVRITNDVVVAGWTFEGDIPGPIVHCRVGDTVEFTLTNEGEIPHSMDFHAAQVDPKTAFRSVPKGESVSFTFRPKWAGAFMYHCGTAPVLMHIGSGMYGAIVVSPQEPLPEAKEFVLVQSEFYLRELDDEEPEDGGVRAFDYEKMLTTLPDFVAFNGRPNQYIDAPIHVKVGDRVRFWLVNCGPTHPCAFHVVGEQFDTVYLGAPPGSPLRGVQTWSVPAGGGMCFELVCDVPGEFPFVNHDFGHGQKGAIGFLVVEP